MRPVGSPVLSSGRSPRHRRLVTSTSKSKTAYWIAAALPSPTQRNLMRLLRDMYAAPKAVRSHACRMFGNEVKFAKPTASVAPAQAPPYPGAKPPD